ncbi:MAG: bifunctional 5,10-methylene-tetrahydrofolate dehydrogenase/5,10-methylene-tetrahydrofolate cyclohydrolase, partial [Bacteroidetes bacterium SW_11_45_7]
DAASQTYVNMKMKACEKVGVQSSLVEYESNVSQDELLAKVDELNHNQDVDGFIVQLPLPRQIAEEKVINAIDPGKDVDGFHPVNVGKMALGMESFVSATPNGILTMLERYNIPTEGKYCVVLGRSNIVGRPLSILLSRKGYPGNSTVTICHSRTPNMKEKAREADILIAAMGRPESITPDMVKEGAVVVDVGTTRVTDETAKRGYRLKGDVKFDEVAEKCSYISPVPGGVGPMTVTSLLMNTVKAAKERDS